VRLPQRKNKTRGAGTPKRACLCKSSFSQRGPRSLPMGKAMCESLGGIGSPSKTGGKDAKGKVATGIARTTSAYSEGGMIESKGG